MVASKTEEQSWYSCKSSVGHEPQNVRQDVTRPECGSPTKSIPLINHPPICGSYCCSNQSVRELTEYPTIQVKDENFSGEAVELFKLGDFGPRILDFDGLKRTDKHIISLFNTVWIISQNLWFC